MMPIDEARDLGNVSRCMGIDSQFMIFPGIKGCLFGPIGHILGNMVGKF